MLTINFDPFPVLSTKRLNLRKVTEDDVNEIFFLRSDKRVMEYLDRAPALSNEDALDFIKKINNLEKNNDCVTWAITLHREEKLAGTICYWNITKEHYRAEIGYALNPDHQGKGIMQEAMAAIIDHGFKTMKLHSIEANVNPHNTASVKLLKRNNFIREGYFKENYFYDGKFLDSAIYSLVTP